MNDSEYECRGMRPEDRDQVVAATISAFGEARTQGYGKHFDARLTKLEDLRVIVHHTPQGSKVVGCCPVFRYPMHFGPGITLMAGGIYMFGIAQAYKRKGLGQRLLEDCNQYLAAKGFDLNMLYTGSPSFYQHKGYELAIHKPRYILSVGNLTADKFRNNKDNFILRPFRKEDLPAIVHIFEVFNQNIPMTRIRDVAYWTQTYNRHPGNMETNIFCIWEQERMVGYIWLNCHKHSIDVFEYGFDTLLQISTQNSIERCLLETLIDLAKTEQIPDVAITLFPRYPLVKQLIELGARDCTAEYSGFMVKILNLSRFLSQFILYQTQQIIPQINGDFLQNCLDMEVILTIEDFCLHYHKIGTKITVEVETSCQIDHGIPIPPAIFGILTIGNWMPSLLVESEMWTCPAALLPFLDQLFPRLYGTIYPLDQF